MKRYYFDLREGDEIFPDEEGLELSTLAKVQEEAARSLADMARDSVRSLGAVAASCRLRSGTTAVRYSNSHSKSNVEGIKFALGQYPQNAWHDCAHHDQTPRSRSRRRRQL